MKLLLKFMCNGFHLYGHKNVEWQIDRFEEWDWFDFQLKWSRCCDHAGFEFHANVLGLFIAFQIYDDRHWDYDKGCWCSYGNT